MYKYITLHRGLNLTLQGAVESGETCAEVKTSRVAIVPDDFPGLTPKVAAKTGERVAEGQSVITDKLHPEIAIVSPVSGIIEDVVRGERRKILRVTIAADGQNAESQKNEKPAGTRESLMAAMKKTGVWVLMRQLPYDIVPDAETIPRDIFITAFDSAPLATSLIDRVSAKTAQIQSGIKALLTLTDGNIYIGVNDIASTARIWGTAAETSNRICIAEFKGKHPAGLASIQAAALAPVNKGDTVWMLDVETLARIGEVAETGSCSWTTTVALTGSEVKKPCMLSTVVGAEIKPMIDDRIKENDHHQRIISGNVLTGTTVGTDGFLHYPYRQLTIIPEGDDVDEFMGWASLSPKKMSESRSFLSKLFSKKGFAPDARLNGGRRAMIMSGEYDKVLPMNILPEYLIKAILARDIDKMEALGIYEVTPADFALCEYIDPSKLELQKIVREGLDYLRKELS